MNPSDLPFAADRQFANSPHDETLGELVRPPDWQNPIPRGRYHLVVIGGGPAGLVTAAGAAGLGAKVALIERNRLGGDCLHTGCVPSKAIIAAARQAARVRDGVGFGVHAEQLRIDFSAAMDRMRRLRASLAPHDSARRFRELGVDVYFGLGEFTSPGTIEVDGRMLSFRRAVIATGSRPAMPLIPGLPQANCLTNESLFDLRQAPRRLAVLGGGPIGCEMAQSFARLGSSVTLIERSVRLLSREDRDASTLIEQALGREGLELRLATELLRVQSRAGHNRLELQGPDGRTFVDADAILVAVGRVPHVEGLGLDRAGVAHSIERGVEVDDGARTSNHRIYAIGDVASQERFTHAADAAARLVIRNALFPGRSRLSRLLIPRCTYTCPELAHVGLGPDQIASRGWSPVTYTQAFSGIDRAVLDGDTTGFVRVHCRSGRDQILGATICGPHAGELIGELTLAMNHRVGLSRIGATIHPYPTHAEAIRKLGDQYQRARFKPWVKTAVSYWLDWCRR